MTPFELELQKTLDAERARFANEWLFPWHNINVQNRVVDVDDFQGRRIHIGGVRFVGQVQLIYWQAIKRYLTHKCQDTVRAWDEGTRSYPIDKRRSSLEATGNLLRGFVAATIQRATETDRRLRGAGYPDSVQEYNSTCEHSHANAEIFRLVESHKALISSRVPRVRLIERLNALGQDYTGLWVIVGLALTAVGLLIAL